MNKYLKLQILLIFNFLFVSCFQLHKINKKNISNQSVTPYCFQEMDSLGFLKLYGLHPSLGVNSCITEYCPNCHFDSIVIITYKSGKYFYDTIPRPKIRK
jgi:hypothetical protein